MPHTPGPWRVDETMHHNMMPGGRPTKTYEVFTSAPIPTHRHIATVEPREGTAAGSALLPSEGGANADLIAAAPDLLEAARAANCGCSIAERESGHRVECWYPALEAAIAKAEGR